MVTGHLLKYDHLLLVSQPLASPIIFPLQANLLTGNGRLALRKSQWRWMTLTEQNVKATTWVRRRQKTDTTTQDKKEHCLVFHCKTTPRKRKSPKLKYWLFYNHYRYLLWWPIIAETCSPVPRNSAGWSTAHPVCVYYWEQRAFIRGDIPACRYLPNIGRSILLRVDLGADGPTSSPALHHGVGGRGGDFILPRVCTAACFLQVLDLLCLLLKNYKFIKWDPPSVLFSGILIF